jgi:hypothetical protein
MEYAPAHTAGASAKLLIYSLHALAEHAWGC